MYLNDIIPIYDLTIMSIQNLMQVEEDSPISVVLKSDLNVHLFFKQLNRIQLYFLDSITKSGSDPSSESQKLNSNLVGFKER